MTHDPQDTWAVDDPGADTWQQSPDSWIQQGWAEGAETDRGPAHKRNSGASIAVGIAGVVVLAAVGIVGALALNGMSQDGDQLVAGSPAGTPVWTTEARAGVAGSEVLDVPVNGAEGGSLDGIVAESSSLVESVEGYWVPQLGAMRIGTGSSAEEQTEEAILAKFESYRTRYPEAALLRSGDWAVYTKPDWYVAIVALPAGDPDTVLNWCRNEGFDPNSCLAKKISQHGTPQGATRVNG